MVSFYSAKGPVMSIESETALDISFEAPSVEGVFAASLADTKGGLRRLRKLIFEVAARTDGVGRL